MAGHRQEGEENRGRWQGIVFANQHFIRKVSGQIFIL
jgi:hypothetical protein